MINFILIPCVSFAIGIIINEYFNIGTRLKKILKIPLEDYKKPYDCRFCMYFWTSTIITLSLSWMVIPQLTIILICCNVFIAQFLENYYE